MIDDKVKWLAEPCDPRDVRQNPDGSEYIPIGIIENKLDILDAAWSTSNFKFRVFVAGKFMYASASAVLHVSYQTVEGKQIYRTIIGAGTFRIYDDDLNQDYEATCLSFCIANASKKLGQQFGRHLNKRLDKGETSSLPIIQLKRELTEEEKTEDERIASEIKKLEEFIVAEPNVEVARKVLLNSPYKFDKMLLQMIEMKLGYESKQDY